MRKIFTIILAGILCFSVVGCSPKSQEVKDTEVMIRAIDTVTDKSGEIIQTAERFYSRLSEEEKTQVSNYDVLVNAREEYNRLIHYGQWVQFFDKDAVTFTLAEDGSFTMSDGGSGSYEITDTAVVLKTADGETLAFDKVVEDNLLHLKTEDADYIRPDLLTVKEEKMVAGKDSRFFYINYHLHMDKDQYGNVNDYWYCAQLMPYEEYAGIVASGTEITITYTYTIRDIAAMKEANEDSLIIMEEITDPVQQTGTITLTGEAFAMEECCNPQYELARGTTSDYKEYKNLIKKLEYIENVEIIDVTGWLHYYNQLL